MSGEKRFRKSLLGYKKKDVNTYIDKLVGEYDQKLSENEEELASLKKQLRDMKAKYDEIVAKTDERTKIAEVLIKAQEKAENIIEEARLKALEEKKKLNDMLEDDRERVVDMKQVLKSLKQNAIQVMKYFDGEIDNLLIENDKQIEDDLKEISWGIAKKLTDKYNHNYEYIIKKCSDNWVNKTFTQFLPILKYYDGKEYMYEICSDLESGVSPKVNYMESSPWVSPWETIKFKFTVCFWQ